ncbi:hypothetical protein NMY22_g16842 [Coprinellus aureogranulatus]|nr:hypothetical protein NMY22_g16842 [Coprinellus aureogranulatus]
MTDHATLCSHSSMSTCNAPLARRYCFHSADVTHTIPFTATVDCAPSPLRTDPTTMASSRRVESPTSLWVWLPFGCPSTSNDHPGSLPRLPMHVDKVDPPQFPLPYSHLPLTALRRDARSEKTPLDNQF